MNELIEFFIHTLILSLPSLALNTRNSLIKRINNINNNNNNNNININNNNININSQFNENYVNSQEIQTIVKQLCMRKIQRIIALIEDTIYFSIV